MSFVLSFFLVTLNFRRILARQEIEQASIESYSTHIYPISLWAEHTKGTNTYKMNALKAIEIFEKQTYRRGVLCAQDGARKVQKGATFSSKRKRWSFLFDLESKITSFVAICLEGSYVSGDCLKRVLWVCPEYHEHAQDDASADISKFKLLKKFWLDNGKLTHCFSLVPSASGNKAVVQGDYDSVL